MKTIIAAMLVLAGIVSACDSPPACHEKLEIGISIADLGSICGQPKAVNESVSLWGIKQQWVYSGGMFVYTENGKVTAWQVAR